MGDIGSKTRSTSNAVTHPWTCTPIASQVMATSPARATAVGIRQPKQPTNANDNSDVRERAGPKVTRDIVH